MPARPRIGAHELAAAGDLARPVHFPDRRLAARVLPQDVGMAVAVEVAGSDRVPAWPRNGAHRPAADDVAPVHLPDRDLAGASVLPQDVRMAVAIEVAGSDRLPAWPWIGSDHSAADDAGPVHLPDRGLAVRVLKQDVGQGIGVEIPRSDR